MQKDTETTYSELIGDLLSAKIHTDSLGTLKYYPSEQVRLYKVYKHGEIWSLAIY